MIVLWGSEQDPPLAAVLDALADRDVDVLYLPPVSIGELAFDLRLGQVGTPLTGWLALGSRRWDITELRGMYLRPTGSGPGATGPAPEALSAVASLAPACVVNRPAAGRSNWSKPYQLQLLAGYGLVGPDTLVTTDPAAARAFLARHGAVIYKSVSGIRSVVAALGPGDADRLDRVTSGPVQLQELIEGTDVRVHVVGRRWFATAVRSAATDYRYAARTGYDLTMTACDLPADLGATLVRVTADLGLVLSGIDLRRTPDGRWFVFEVNPSPGFSFYEDHTGQPIADAIADELEQGWPTAPPVAPGHRPLRG